MRYTKVVDKKIELVEFLQESFLIDRVFGLKQISRGEVRVDGVKCTKNITVLQGNAVSIFLPKSTEGQSKNRATVDIKHNLQDCIKYNDDNILIIDKPQGVAVEQLLSWVVVKFKSASLVHRLDRNTRGLIILAKTERVGQQLTDAIKRGCISKHYYAKVNGVLSHGGRLELYMFKDSDKSISIVSDCKKQGYKLAITEYDIISRNDDYTEVGIKLITGRTHQIRACMAYLGHFVLGDGKYGNNKINHQYGYKMQQLKAVKLVFNNMPSGLEYLNDMSFLLDNNI